MWDEIHALMMETIRLLTFQAADRSFPSRGEEIGPRGSPLERPSAKPLEDAPFAAAPTIRAEPRRCL